MRTAFHLRRIAKTLNAKYFGGSLDFAIGWMRPPRKKYSAESSATLAYYVECLHTSHGQIRVNCLFKNTQIPTKVLCGVILHELLHIVRPAFPTYRPFSSNSSFRVIWKIHHCAYRLAENSHPLIGRAFRWINLNWPSIVEL